MMDKKFEFTFFPLSTILQKDDNSGDTERIGLQRLITSNKKCGILLFFSSLL